MATCRILKLQPLSFTLYKINSKWIKNLNIRPKTLKQILKTLKDLGIRNAFLNKTPIAQEIRARISKQDHIQLNKFSQQKKNLSESRDNL
jgi:hypothetical protein